MATLLFSAIGASVGGSLLGSAVGATMGAAIGRGLGGLLGNKIDQFLFGSDVETVQSEARERLSFTNSRVGQSVPQVFGRSRLAGQIIWAEQVTAVPNDGGYTYVTSFAVAICEGEVHRIGRIWANNQQVEIDRSQFRFYRGAERQTPDPLIANDVGERYAPAFNGICYLVFDGLDLTEFGSSIPNLEFEVFRHASDPTYSEIKDHVTAVSIIPGTGEYALESQKVEQSTDVGEGRVLNAHRDGTQTDFDHAIEQLVSDAPNVRSASLVISWFGNDLRCSNCQIMPKVEQIAYDGSIPWSAGGISRAEALPVSRLDNKAVYGGTPSDASVVNAIQKLNKTGIEVMFYPFILMDIPRGNFLQTPWKEAGFQPANPWRGRITTSKAAGVTGSTDRTANARIEVDAFMGDAQIDDFVMQNGAVSYLGEPVWGYRRFILHYAHLCVLAGGVEEFIIGSELIGLTTIRDNNDKFPFVEHLITLANDVRTILGSRTKISYAADWSEYFGYHPEGEPASAYFHLDELWASPNIDFIGIDNYMPMSDWRNDAEHVDASFGSVYNLQYLQSNVCGGEGYDWYYASDKDRDHQIRSPITDGQNEPWLWRYKDLQNWWSNRHYNRPDAVRESSATSWKPYSKPIRFTEYGAAALDLSSNQPNKFLDLHSSESSLPYFSDGSQDSYIQACYIRAFNNYWNDPSHNPISMVNGAQMVETQKSYCWTWDARPWPEFPARTDIWADGVVFSRGHWLSSRVNAVSLANVVSEICKQAGITNIDVSELYGFVEGVMYGGDETARQKIDLLMRAFQFDAFVKEGKLTFKSRDLNNTRIVDEDLLVAADTGGTVKTTIASPNSRSGQFEIHYVDGEDAYLPATAQLLVSDRNSDDRLALDLPVVMSNETAKGLLEYYIWQSRQSEEKISFKIAKLGAHHKVGDIISLPKNKGTKRFRIDRVTTSTFLEIEATCLENYQTKQSESVALAPAILPVQAKSVYAQFLDVPIGGNEGLHIAFGAKPWVGEVGLIETSPNSDTKLLTAPYASTMGRLTTKLPNGRAGRKQHVSVSVKMINGSLTNHGAVHDNLDRSCLAIGPDQDGNWELLGYERVEPLGNDNYQLHGIYRGVLGSDNLVSDWAEDTNVVAFDGRLGFLSIDKFSDIDEHQLAFGPTKDLSFWKEQTVMDPAQYSKPLSPCHLRAVRTGEDVSVSFVPRLRLDKDIWRNGLQVDPDDQSFEIEVTVNSEIVFSEISSDTNHQFACSGNQLEVSVRSICSHNLKSNFVKEVLYV